MKQSIEIFCCAAGSDQSYLEKLKKHLAPLKRKGSIKLWDESSLRMGEESREEQIEQHLKKAGVFLLLISAEFLASDYCYETVMKAALARYKNKAAKVIPVIVRSADWDTSELQDIPVLPRDRKALNTHPSNKQDKLLMEVAQEIKRIVSELLSVVPDSADSGILTAPPMLARGLSTFPPNLPPFDWMVKHGHITRKKLVISVLVVVFIVGVILGILSLTRIIGPYDSIVTNLMDQDVIAAKSHDVESLPQIYAYNAVIIDDRCPSSSPFATWSGLPAITDRYESLPPFIWLAHVNVHITWMPDNFWATRATATSDTSGIAVVNGSQISLKGRELWAFAKIDGQWRITSFTYDLC